jgi:hypothetical protein
VLPENLILTRPTRECSSAGLCIEACDSEIERQYQRLLEFHMTLLEMTHLRCRSVAAIAPPNEAHEPAPSPAPHMYECSRGNHGRRPAVAEPRAFY